MQYLPHLFPAPPIHSEGSTSSRKVQALRSSHGGTIESGRLHPHRRNHPPAFTLIELLVVMAIVAVLASMLLPSLTRAKQKAMNIQCLNNHRQLALAWVMYADDNDSRLPAAAGMTQESDAYAWLKGYCDFDGANRYNWDLDYSVKSGALWAYSGGSAGIYKCPAEKSYVIPTTGPSRGKRVERVRSMTMSCWMGGPGLLDWGGGPGLSAKIWRINAKLSDIGEPSPSMSLVFGDTREDINLWPFTNIDMSGYPDRPELAQLAYDLIPFNHGGATSYSFADGHSELRKWKDSRTMVPVWNQKIQNGGIRKQPNNPDLRWMQERATRRQDGK